MEDLVEHLVRGALRIMLWGLRFLAEAVVEVFVEGLWELSKLRTWVGWLPASASSVGLAGAAFVCLQRGAGTAAVVLWVLATLPMAGRAIYLWRTNGR